MLGIKEWITQQAGSARLDKAWNPTLLPDNGFSCLCDRAFLSPSQSSGNQLLSSAHPRHQGFIAVPTTPPRIVMWASLTYLLGFFAVPILIRRASLRGSKLRLRRRGRRHRPPCWP